MDFNASKHLSYHREFYHTGLVSNADEQIDVMYISEVELSKLDD